MCSVILLHRPGHPWPILLAANRDERLDRPWRPPARHWPERPDLLAGQDVLAGGTWLGLAITAGVVAAVLNRPGSLGPEAGKRSRGELPLLALAEASAAAAAERVAALDAGQWRPFHLLIADRTGAWFLRGLGEGRPQARPLPPGLWMVTSAEPNDVSHPRIRRALPRFAAAAPPDPECEDWATWETLLADRAEDAPEGRAAALAIPPADGFGTVCSSLIALAQDGRARWRFCDRPAGEAPFRPCLA